MSVYGLKDAEKIISKAYWNAIKQMAVIDSLRRIAGAGMPHACQVVAQENNDWVQSHSEFYEKYGIAAQVMTESCVERAQYAIDAASLVFAHSVLDEVVYQFCLASAAACPSDWETPLLKKQIALVEMKGKSFDDVLKGRLKIYLEKELSTFSMPEKARRLFAACKPADDWVPQDLARVYTYDRERLEKLDNLRHKVVHGLAPLNGLGIFDNESFFMNMTVIYWLKMVEERCGIVVNPTHYLEDS
ncbi:MAG: hypothetical protein M1133_02325 [Armatimonadetes bacterium]|nr:hypothetical protein [Armatimonadota bacterium]